ncbi:MAG: FKBP-type peptidyl-prolyl cis-trans isomerase [Schleiferiaceae bacterium]|nr:FKBP-type peptidyl-prolyl cis-trans isomerase [Schleiferiaceae bacterium]
MDKIVGIDKIVEIKYELREGGLGGDLLEIMDEHWPLKFYFGSSIMLPAFENHIKGLREGESFSFLLPADQAYGHIDPALIREVPLKQFENDMWFDPENLEVGDRVSINAAHTKGGAQIGVITEKSEKNILVDFNHSLAGKDLHFSGQILFIREPMVDERVHQRYIEPNGIRSNSRLSDGPDL